MRPFLVVSLAAYLATLAIALLYRHRFFAIFAGVVLGMRVPIVLTSRSDSVASRIASCALAVLVSRQRHAALPTPLESGA